MPDDLTVVDSQPLPDLKVVNSQPLQQSPYDRATAAGLTTASKTPLETLRDKLGGYIDEKDHAALLEAAKTGKAPEGQVWSSFGPRMIKGLLDKVTSAAEPENAAKAAGIIAANTNPVTAVPVDAALMYGGARAAAQNAPAAVQGNPEAIDAALSGASQAVGAGAGLGQSGPAAVQTVRNVPGAVGNALRQPATAASGPMYGELRPGVQAVAKMGKMVGAPELLNDLLIPERSGGPPGEYIRIPKRVPAAQVQAMKSAAQQGVPLSDLASLGEQPSGVTVVPEPRALQPGEKVGYNASTPRDLLLGNALAGRPGAADMIRNTGQPVIYAPSGLGISNLKSSVALRDLLNRQTLNEVGANGARPIVSPEAQFESSFGPEHKEVGDLAEWETGNREGVKVDDLDNAAKSMFGAKGFDDLTQAQKDHVLRIAQTQVVVP